MLHVAGISGRKFGDGPLHECSDGGWDRVMEINAVRRLPDQPRRRPVHAAAAGRRVRAAGHGGERRLRCWTAPRRRSHFGTIAYAASKGAIRSLTLAAAAAYAPDRIRFNLLVPGLIDTPMAARAVNDPRIRPYVAARQPIAGGPGSAEDVAEAALYLCEPASRFVTGAELVVDGGWCVSEGAARGTGFQPVSG